MSYILDALKKADADREREAAAVPDLYAQADAARGALAAERGPAWVMPAGVVGAIALAALAWWWLRSGADDVPAVGLVAQATSTAPAPARAPLPAPAPAPVPAPAPLPAPAPAPFAAPAPMQLQAPAPAAPPAVVAAPAPAPASAPVFVPAPTPARPAAVRVAAPSAEAAPPLASAASALTADARLPTLAELPPALRSQLPALTVGGSMYSPKPASRMVILNGQVFREGDKPIDGLSVEQIRLKSTVLVFRGVRFELKH